MNETKTALSKNEIVNSINLIYSEDKRNHQLFYDMMMAGTLGIEFKESINNVVAEFLNKILANYGYNLFSLNNDLTLCFIQNYVELNNISLYRIKDNHNSIVWSSKMFSNKIVPFVVKDMHSYYTFERLYPVFDKYFNDIETLTLIYNILNKSNLDMWNDRKAYAQSKGMDSEIILDTPNIRIDKYLSLDSYKLTYKNNPTDKVFYSEVEILKTLENLCTDITNTINKIKN